MQLFRWLKPFQLLDVKTGSNSIIRIFKTLYRISSLSFFSFGQSKLHCSAFLSSRDLYRFILQATGDPYYLEAGRTILDNLNRFARVPCGFAAMKDVRTGSHEDRSVYEDCFLSWQKMFKTR